MEAKMSWADFTLAFRAWSVVTWWEPGSAPHFGSSGQVGNNSKALMFVNVCLSFWDGLSPETIAVRPCASSGKVRPPASAMLAVLYRHSAWHSFIPSLSLLPCETERFAFKLAELCFQCFYCYSFSLLKWSFLKLLLFSYDNHFHIVMIWKSLDWCY